ncbi:MAG: hypothetical protein CVU79_02040 [Elusimicrobia bacterium HGW-Elusimicrobia-3]|nr:MAG: hypothetical protein CVU79_02040 [Elusimicrobia bacterium HGW-Elusimicrobia-3]
MSDQKKTKILLAEDDETFRNFCVRTLLESGYDVKTAASGDEAAALAGDFPDILVSDISMPGKINGLDLTRIYKNAGYTDVIIMTGEPDLDTAVEALKLGAYDYLFKPFTADFLLGAVRRCEEKRNLSDNLKRETALREELFKVYFELTKLSKLRETFGQFVSREIAGFLTDHADNSGIKAGKLPVTVLFADVRNFTAFSAAGEPAEVASALNEILTIVYNGVNSEKGILNKFLGDGAMAFWGAPLKEERHAQAAARAALRIRKDMEAWAAMRVERGLPVMALGIGINTGQVMAGCVGAPERSEYTVMGSVVNLASRLVGAAGEGEILLGPDTASVLRGGFDLKSRGRMKFQGIEEPVEAYELLG